MPYTQIKNLLNQAIEFHKSLAELYSRIDSESEKDSVKLLANYMARHEKVLKERLGSITVERQKQLAEEWVKNEPKFAKKCCIEDLEIDKNSSVDDVVDAGLRLNQCLIDYYHRIAEIAPSEEMKEMFLELEIMEISEKKKLSRIRGM